MMQPSSSGRGGAWASGDDMAIFNAVVIAVGAVVFGYLAWSSYHGEISAAMIAWRRFEIGMLWHFTDRFAEADRQMAAANPHQVTIGALYRISHAVGTAWRLPACIVMVLLASVCVLRSAPSRYRRRFDLSALAREQSRTFKAAAAHLGRELKLVAPASEPLPADYALTPEEWIERYALGASRQLDEPAAKAALKLQLGKPWRGPATASPAALVMFVASALHLNQKRDSAIRLLSDVAEALAPLSSDGSGLGPSKPLIISHDILAECRSLLKEPGAIDAAIEITNRHAWTATALMSLLNSARIRHGVLPPAQFSWLKLVDRPLWYALQSLGYETEGTGRYLHPNPRVEAAGARDHWAVERAAGIPIIEPAVDRAIVALQWRARRLHPLRVVSIRNRASHTGRANQP